MSAHAAQPPLFTRDFLLACLAALAAFASFYLLLASLPLYVLHLGGSEAGVGLAMGVMSATAVAVRLWIGREVDRRGARGFMVLGMAALALVSLAYLAASSFGWLLVVRALHGVGWAVFGTAASGFAAALAPATRRGEAMGYYGMFSNLAMALGPALGLALVGSYGFPTLFVATAAVAMIGVGLVLAIGARGPLTAEVSSDARLVEPTAIFPSAAFALVTVTYASVVSFLPVYARQRDLPNSGYFFAAYAIALASSRSVTGALSDRLGRAASVVPGFLLAAASLVLLTSARSLLAFIGVAALYGLAMALLQPAFLALIIDRAPAGRRGAAMGTFSTAIDLGIAGGSFLWGLVAQHLGYEAMYRGAALVALLGLALFLLGGGARRATLVPR